MKLQIDVTLLEAKEQLCQEPDGVKAVWYAAEFGTLPKQLGMAEVDTLPSEARAGHVEINRLSEHEGVILGLRAGRKYRLTLESIE